MKQEYETLEVKFIILHNKDIVTASDSTFVEQGFDFGDYFNNGTGGDIE